MPANKINLSIRRQALVDCHQRIVALCQDAFTLADAQATHEGYVAVLPMCGSFSTHKGSTTQHYTGPDALASGLRMIALLNYDGNHQQTSEVRRLPGVIGVNKPLLKCLKAINSLKREYKSLWSALSPEQRDQLKTSTKALSRICTMHLYRKIEVLDYQPISIKCNWQIAGRKMQQLTRDETHRYLEKVANSPPKNVSLEAWNRTILDNIDQVSRLPANELLAIKTSGTMMPTISIVHPSDQQVGATQITQSMPLFYLMDETLPPPVITPLREQETHKKQRRPSMLETTPLNRVLNLYQYLPQYRFGLTEDPTKVILETEHTTKSSTLTVCLHNRDSEIDITLTGDRTNFIKAANRVLFNTTGKQLNAQSIVWETTQGSLRFYATTQKMVFIILRMGTINHSFKITTKNLKLTFSDSIQGL